MVLPRIIDKVNTVKSMSGRVATAACMRLPIALVASR
jgi:hypothetical protein